MVDIARDLLGDLERADQTAKPGTRAEDRYVAAIMRRNRVSEADIAASLGVAEGETGSESAPSGRSRVPG